MAQDGGKKQRAVSPRTILRYVFLAAVMCLALAGGIYGAQRFEQFLIRDPRFFLPGPADYGQESPNVELHGVQYASRARIVRLFDEDYGRSVDLVPLAARRKALLEVSWVRDASILRVWPDRLVVSVREREPVAFIKLPASGITRWALIDEDGAILDPPQRAPFRLPVLSGVLSGESPANRARRVKRMQQLMKELGGLSDRISEVDVSDLDDLKISAQIQGSAVSLLMGDRNFAPRLTNFLAHYPDIHRKMPQSATFDLRLDDRITGLEDTGAR
ncbi:MAG TPA: FtsQ-type POTRA domain-containing protein [Bryobacteraceae bacterium]|nr:FtsQ-type POTRA domain-containing protein [Bryobacteraceae bacterium]